MPKNPRRSLSESLLRMRQCITIETTEEQEMKTFDPLPDFVSGPISLSEHYNPVYNKHIYIFGEVHDIQDEPCGSFERVLPIHIFLKRLIEYQSHNQVIDIFLEDKRRINRERFDKIPTLKPGEDLQNIRSYFSSYLDVEKDHDPFQFGDSETGRPRARFHNVDVRPRFIDYCQVNPSEIHTVLFEMLCLCNRAEEDEHEFNLLPTRLKEFLMINESDLNVLEQFVGLTKEVYKINDPELRYWFEQEIVTQRQLSIQSYLQHLQRFDHSTNGINRIIEQNRFIRYVIIKMLAYVMDLYLLARIFKHVSGAPPFDRVIIYAGDNHSNYYRKCLDRLGFDSRQTRNDANVKCVDIRPFKPFFNR